MTELIRLNDTERRTLLELAREIIHNEVVNGVFSLPDPQEHSPALQAERAAFVSLHRHGRLRGCIGTLEAHQPLVQDVALHARAAAIHDPRFPRLQTTELANLSIHIEVLTSPTPLPVNDEAALLALLRPGIDGLVLHHGHQRATFLPAVWESLPDPRDFLYHLKTKAGLDADFWSEQLRFERYVTEAFP